MGRFDNKSDDFYRELELKLKTGIPIIQIISYEWRRMQAFAIKIANLNNRELYIWNNIEGCVKLDRNENNKNCFEPVEDISDATDPAVVLKWFYEKTNNDAILLMEDLYLFFNSNEILGHLRRISRNNKNKTLLLSQPIKELPKLLEKDVYIMELPLPNKTVLKTNIKIINTELKLQEDNSPEEDWDAIAEAALGLTEFEAKNTFKEIAIQNERLTKKEIPFIVKQKEQIIKKSGILEYFHPFENLEDVGGMDNLKEWLDARAAGFSSDAEDFGMTPPKGVLLLGVQGCGKSLISKAIASKWNLPLLKFDLGRVFGGIIGQSEANIRTALETAKAISPCILWIDEIEKGFSGVGSSDRSDGGTTARVFGTMLTWMQEKKEPVFVIATANNIEQLPPELLRKGRFDEIFFVDLPGILSRKQIWEIHLKKRLRGRYNTNKFDLNLLSKESKGFSGAEIEEAINEALYRVYNEKRDLETSDLLDAIRSTYPLSKVMTDKINKLREWAKVRARLANDEDIEKLSTEQRFVPKLKQEVDNPFIE
jgi:SpoVK/Ycf46/Vps4 family AAA+-type ATPase